ncbi:MAG: helix-turn-helix transcriptional regulator [Sneathiellales bacterium]|nr:helix-turn-helix transcriptional regulator [Sneathiellales bacterium]
MISEYIDGVGLFATIRQAEKARFRRLDFQNSAVVRVHSGCKIIHKGDQVFKACEGEAVFLTAGQTLDITNEFGKSGYYDAEIFLFDNQLINTFRHSGKMEIGEGGASILSFEVSDMLAASFERVKTSFLEKKEYPRSIRAHQMEEIAIWLEQEGVVFNTSVKKDLQSRVKSHLQSDLSKDWKAEDLCRALGFSEATFRRKLKAEGYSFSGLLNECRMMQALFLLHSSDLSILQVSHEVGYASPSKFAQRFKERFELSPSQIRKRDYERIGIEFDRDGGALTA